MEQFLAAAIAELLKYGLLGLFAAYMIYKNHQLEKDNDAKDQRIQELLEKRVSEAIVATNAANALASSNDRVGEALNKLDDRLEKIEDRLDARNRQ